MTEPAVLATVWRGPILEIVVRGHAAAVDGEGRLIEAFGDPGHRTPMRSTVKAVQAAPLARSVPALPDDELAIACASHDGEPRHTEVVQRLLTRAGATEADLSCGPQLPYGRRAAAELLAADEPPRRIHNNCSGKHAGMLMACRARDLPQTGYARAEHPLQREIHDHLERLAGEELDLAGTDGCGLPTLAVSIAGLARLFCRGTQDAAVARGHAAMAGHPLLIAGPGRFDTRWLERAGESAVAKSGGAAVWAGARRDGHAALALKLEAGSAEWLAPVATALAARWGILDAADAEALSGVEQWTVRNWAGAAVGEVRLGFDSKA